MGKLYFFGDSFVADIPTKDTSALKLTKQVEQKQVWTFQLAELLHCEPIFVSVSGSGLDWCQFQFDRRLKKINKDKDYIIVSHTAPTRRWFVEKSPQCSNFLNYITPNGDLNKRFLTPMKGMSETASNGVSSFHQAEIGRHYALGVARQELEFLYGESIVTYFRHFQREGYKIINIPATHEPESYSVEHNEYFKTIGNLDVVARSEFVGDNKLTAFTEILGGADGRMNHLSSDNHQILTQKLYKTFTESTDLDFTTDFKSNFITKKNWESYNTLGMIPNNLG